MKFWCLEARGKSVGSHRLICQRILVRGMLEVILSNLPVLPIFLLLGCQFKSFLEASGRRSLGEHWHIWFFRSHWWSETWLRLSPSGSSWTILREMCLRSIGIWSCWVRMVPRLPVNLPSMIPLLLQFLGALRWFFDAKILNPCVSSETGNSCFCFWI